MMFTKKSGGGGGGVGGVRVGGIRVAGVRVDVNEDLKFVCFLFLFFLGGGGRVGGVGLGGQGGCDRKIEAFGKIHTK